MHTFTFGTVVATEHMTLFLQAVTNDADTAVKTARGQSMDGTLETVKRIALATKACDLKGLVIVIATIVTLSHKKTSFTKFIWVMVISRKENREDS